MLVAQPSSGGGLAAQGQSDGGQETFIQRMRRIKGQQDSAAAGIPQQGQQTSPYAGGQSTDSSYTAPTQPQSSGQPRVMGRQFNNAAQPSTPVSGDGTIPPPQPPAAPQQVAFGMGAQTPMPQPMPQQFQPQPTTVGTGAPTADQFLTGSQMQPFTVGNPLAPSYQQTQVGTGPNPNAYRGTSFSQFQAPDQTALNTGQANLASAILGNPESMSPDVVTAMQNANKETALAQQKQAAMGINAAAAARGLSGGGSEMGDLMRLGDQTNSNILAGNRDIATQAAQTNFNNRLAALSGVDTSMNSAANRASQLYNTQLQGQQATAADRQAVANSQLQNAAFGLSKQQATAANNLQNYNVGRQNQQDQLNRELSQFGINQAIAGQNLSGYNAVTGNANTNKSLDIQQALGQAGIGLDRDKLNSANTQFQQNYGLSLADLLERAREANNNLGFNYDQLSTNGQNSTINQILSILNSGG